MGQKKYNRFVKYNKPNHNMQGQKSETSKKQVLQTTGRERIAYPPSFCSYPCPHHRQEVR